MDNKYSGNMTKLTRDAFRKATEEIGSKEEAVSFLKNELITRNVRNIIEKFSNGRDIKETQTLLVDGLMENHEGMIKESVERRVRGWLNPKSIHTIRKKDAIETAFILQLNLKDADSFVSLISEEHLHWRSVEEIIYIFGLKYGLTYLECREIMQKAEIQDVLSKVKDYKTVEEISEDRYTEFVMDDVEQITSVEGLVRYLTEKENYKRFGDFHNTAYNMFMEMIGKLESPEMFESNEDKPKYTIRDILVDSFYCTREVKSGKDKESVKISLISKEKKQALDSIRKVIAAEWPDEVSLSKMKNRKMDITRKCLILLFLATDGDYEEDGFYYDVPEEEVFKDIMERMNDMLFFSGFSELDPRNPFDWLIIYCICVSDVLDIDAKMQSVIDDLFRKEDE